ncbi:hypothetical protein ALC60_01037 [Trachymyrmex zeteki]|uniref:Uncharacterized protein n=1 Tax=Mycetomoellerius zeteki TaxID=64791 RepID=A0A151XIA3_9HYME|nr:hypothetical protein ALC60_01037 [Trachymyrmex zeteki]
MSAYNRRNQKGNEKCNSTLTYKPQAARWLWQWKVTGDCDGVAGCTSRTCDGEARFACFEIPLPREMRSVHGSDSLSVIFSRAFLYLL